MERSLILGSLAIGGIGWACALALALMRTRPGENVPPAGSFFSDAAARRFWWVAIALPIAVWAMTLPVAPPFSPGQGWGRGFLLGGIGALAGALPLLARSCNGLARRAAAIAPFFVALPVGAVPLLWMRASVIDALSGVAAGWLLVSFALLLGMAAATTKQSVANPEPGNHEVSFIFPLAALSLVNGAGFAIALCAACALGVYRDFIVADVARGTHSAVALALACAAPLSLLCGALLREIVGAARSAARSSSASSRALFAPDAAASALLLPITLLALAYLLATRVLDETNIFSAAGIGLLTAFIAWWMARDGETGGFAVPPLAVLVVLCGFMASYQLMQGFGVGLMLLAAWPVAALATSSSDAPSSDAPSSKLSDAPSDAVPDEASPQHHDRAQNVSLALSLLLLFATILLLSRLFATRFRADLRGASLSDHYALFGFLVGAALPARLAGVPFRAADMEAANAAGSPSSLANGLLNTSLPRLVFAGALALAVPGAMLALWGAKCAPALLAGLALATVLGSGAASRWPKFQSLQPLLCAFFALAVALAVTQWAGHVLPLSGASRAERLRALLWGGGLLAALLLLADYGGRLVDRLRKRKAV